jgi:hypothetical protein
VNELVSEPEDLVPARAPHGWSLEVREPRGVRRDPEARSRGRSWREPGPACWHGTLHDPVERRRLGHPTGMAGQRSPGCTRTDLVHHRRPRSPGHRGAAVVFSPTSRLSPSDRT